MRTERGVNRFIGQEASQATCRHPGLDAVRGNRRSQKQLAAAARNETLRYELRMYVRTPQCGS
jgi:hypothetical protein